MREMKKFACLFLAAMLALCMVGCGEKEEAASSDSDVMLGLIGALTGDYADYGNSVKDGAQIAVDEINEAGGVNGCTFTLNAQDSQGKPDSAVAAYGKLMDDGMDVSIGCVMSGEATSVITTAAADQLLIVTPTSSALDCIENNDQAFRICFNDAAQGSAAAGYIADHDLGTKVAIFYQSDIDYSLGCYETFVAEAAQKGLEIVEEQTFTEGTKTDFSTQVNAIRDSGCDLVFLPIYATEAANFLTQASGKLDDKVFFGCDGMDGIHTKVSDVSIIEGLMLLTPFAADDPDETVSSFVAKYRDSHDGEDPDQFAADGYDAVYTVKAAMEKCGKTPADGDFSQAMVAAMYEISVHGVTGDMSWGESREPIKPAKAMQYQDGAAVLFADAN